MTYIIRTSCCKCGDRCEAYGISSDGEYCVDCSPRLHCHDCGDSYPRDLLTDLGDGYLSCDDCQLEVVARQAQAGWAPDPGYAMLGVE